MFLLNFVLAKAIFTLSDRIFAKKYSINALILIPNKK